MIPSLSKQKHIKSTVDARIGKLQFQSIKQIQSQISQMRPREALEALRAGGEAGRFRGLFPPLAFQPRHHCRAHHRAKARHRRHCRRLLSAQDARRRTVPRAVESADGAMSMNLAGELMHEILQPKGWAKPIGYANGVAARGPACVRRRTGWLDRRAVASRRTISPARSGRHWKTSSRCWPKPERSRNTSRQ